MRARLSLYGVFFGLLTVAWVLWVMTNAQHDVAWSGGTPLPSPSPLTGVAYAAAVVGVVILATELLLFPLNASKKDERRSGDLAVRALDSARDLVSCRQGQPESIEEWEQRSSEAGLMLEQAHQSASALAILGRTDKSRTNAANLSESLRCLRVALQAPRILARAGISCPSDDAEADDYWRRRKARIETAIQKAEHGLANLR